MRLAIILLLVCTDIAFAAVGWIDSSGALVNVASAPGSPPAGVTEIPIELTAEAGRPSLLFDKSGNCMYSAAKDGKPVKLDTPRPPVGPASKALSIVRLVAEWDRLTAAAAPLQAWQADPELVAVLDRSAELSRITDRISEIKTAITAR